MSSDHRPIRPSWQCLHCGADWPCDARRGELVAESYGSRVHLALVMTHYLVEALDDQPGTSPRQLYTRFVGWVRWRG